MRSKMYDAYMDLSLLNIDVAANIILRTVVIFLYAFLLLRLLGKRHLSHLMYTDLMVIISFGSAVGDVMIYGENITRILTAMLAITVVAILVKILEELASHNNVASHVIDGAARLLIDKGKLVAHALERENLSEESVLSLLRQKDISAIREVRKAFIEPDGELSVITYKRNNH